MNKTILLLGFVFLVLISSVSAINFYVDEAATLYSTCLLANGTLGGDNMTISIYYPNATLFVNEDLMTNYDTGQFSYDFTVPNLEGTYPYTMTCNTATNTFSGSDSFDVFEYDVKDLVTINNTTNVDTFEIGIFMVLALFIVFTLMIGLHKLKLSKNEDMNTGISYSARMISYMLIWVLFGLIQNITESQTYAEILSTVYIVVGYLVLALIMIETIVNLWSFIPLIVKKGFNWVNNQ